MTSPDTCSDRNHLTSARSVASGGAVGALLATVCFQEPVPSLPDLSLPVGRGVSPTKVPCPGCNGRQFLELAPKGRSAQLLPFDGADLFPTFFKRPRFSLSDSLPHDRSPVRYKKYSRDGMLNQAGLSAQCRRRVGKSQKRGGGPGLDPGAGR